MVVITPMNSRVKIGGGYAILVSDAMIISGCPFNISGSPLPCTTIQWMNESVSIKVNGQAVLLDTSIGLCKNPAGAPQGAAIISGTQTQGSGR